MRLSAQEAERLMSRMEGRAVRRSLQGPQLGNSPERMPASQGGIYVVLSLPHKALWPNRRGHWSTYQKWARRYRREAGWAARVEWRASQNHREPWKAAKVRAVFHWPDKRKRDKDNAMAAIKSALDGLQDAGVIADDCGLRPQEPIFMVDRERPRLVLEVWPVDE